MLSTIDWCNWRSGCFMTDEACAMQKSVIFSSGGRAVPSRKKQRMQCKKWRREHMGIGEDPIKQDTLACGGWSGSGGGKGEPQRAAARTGRQSAAEID
jgi:hypothetical protein